MDTRTPPYYPLYSQIPIGLSVWATYMNICAITRNDLAFVTPVVTSNTYPETEYSILIGRCTNLQKSCDKAYSGSEVELPNRIKGPR
jgi:hypothetical protein